MLCVPSAAAAQTLPSGPIRAMDGQLLVSGEVVATMSDTDNIAFFNYTDYEHNALRLFRVSAVGRVAAGPPARVRRRAADGGSRSPSGVRRLRSLQTVGRQRVRHSGRPDSAVVRRVQPARLHDRQPGDRVPARLSVSDLDPPGRGARTRGGSDPDAGARLALELSRRQSRHPAPVCRSSAPSAGTPACRRTGKPESSTPPGP